MQARAGKWLPSAALSVLVALGGCDYHDPAVGGNQKDNPSVGNMNDHSYSGLVTEGSVVTRVNGLGQPVAMDRFRGKFVWATYAAPWCRPCVSQASAVKTIENESPRRTVFLTVMTSKSTKYNDVPNQETARVWADRFGLDRSCVLAATNLWAWTVPAHILYSPHGQTLYRSTGYLSADQIRYIRNRYVQEWELHATTGKTAGWMLFGMMAPSWYMPAVPDSLTDNPWGG